MLFFFFYAYCAHRNLPSFPTRRSSDLPAQTREFAKRRPRARGNGPQLSTVGSRPSSQEFLACTCETRAARCRRSEEHTSELQSLRHLVCRLLLEKKKKKITKNEDDKNN